VEYRRYTAICWLRRSHDATVRARAPRSSFGGFTAQRRLPDGARHRPQAGFMLVERPRRREAALAYFLQSSSSRRIAAAAVGFLTFTQQSARPEAIWRAETLARCSPWVSVSRGILGARSGPARMSSDRFGHVRIEREIRVCLTGENLAGLKCLQENYFFYPRGNGIDARNLAFFCPPPSDRIRAGAMCAPIVLFA
jgi:hypothetical protein